jgi:hypothetical protein
MEIGLTLQSQAMGKDAVYYSGQLIELYKLVYVPFKTEGHSWGPFLVSKLEIDYDSLFSPLHPHSQFIFF